MSIAVKLDTTFKGYCIKHYRRWQRSGDPHYKQKRMYGEGTIMPSGHIVVEINGKRVQQHRWLMEQHIGRALRKGEIVHHINGDPADNRIENLEVMNISDHIKHHKIGRYHKGNSTTHRRCCKCKRLKSLDEYNKVSRNVLSKSYVCRKCTVKINAKRN